MSNTIESYGLVIDAGLHRFIAEEALPGTGISEDRFWSGLAALATEMVPVNRFLLRERDRLQSQIDEWYRTGNGRNASVDKHAAFLRKIGYLKPSGANFKIETFNADREIADVAGPQLVVPLINTRFALNAANARWGSLYDALYSTDVLGPPPSGSHYDTARGTQVIAWARAWLDRIAPLTGGSHAEVIRYTIQDDQLVAAHSTGTHRLAEPSLLRGFRGTKAEPSSLLLCHNGLHIEIVIDRNHPIGATDSAGIADILIEAALSTIMDCEDSVAAVDANDKVTIYRNWLGLMRGTLSAAFEKKGKSLTRMLASDRDYTDINDRPLSLPGRSLMLVRNVGHLMTTDAVRLPDNSEMPEGILDGVVTSLIAMHDLKSNGPTKNSRTGSVYIVKPKMHGPDEAAFANRLFDAIEGLLGLPRFTLKIGLMDEERRTSLNLGECIRQLRGRIFFINTGFLDRTGDEIHTAMEAGPMMRKGDMKTSRWLTTYEDMNVDTGLKCGFEGKAQIGKGMWAMPDLMAAMLTTKIGHPRAGANTAWVPSPTAATLHALHYHDVNVRQEQKVIAKRAAADPNGLLAIPVVKSPTWTPEEIKSEIENNVQGLLGYVVRWIDQGVGCSKVPDIANIGLMEDRATLRISSQHLANWLHHGVCTPDQVLEIMKRMAGIVDQQNKDDPAYRPMSADLDMSIAFQAARDLVFKGTGQPNGYTEPLLHFYRRKVKQQAASAL